MRFSALCRREFVMCVAAVGCVALLPAFGDDKVPSGKQQEKSPDIGPPTKEDLADPRMIYIKSVLSRFTVEVGGREAAAKTSDPCLRWTNPINDIRDGALAVYTFEGGRPAAVGTFFHNGPKSWCAEFSIIASDNVRVTHLGQPFWRPSEYVCKFADVADSPVPAAKAPLRLVQMRKIAENFSAIV